MVTMLKYIKITVESLSLLKYNWVIKIRMHHRKHIYNETFFKYKNMCEDIYKRHKN